MRSLGIIATALAFWPASWGSAQQPIEVGATAPVVAYGQYETPVVGEVTTATASPAVVYLSDSSALVPVANQIPSSAPQYSGTVTATVAQPTQNWALDVANAQAALNPNRFPNIASARQRLDAAMMELENFLASAPQHQSNWLAFLAWNDLHNELKKNAPDQDRLTQIEKTFRQNYLGLEYRQFTNVRDSLQAYVRALRFSSDLTKSTEIFNNRLNKLSEQLQMPGVTGDFETTREIGQTLAYLAQANQAEGLVNSVRRLYSRSNVRVLISADFIHSRFNRPVSEYNPVDEVILGTQLYGHSWLNGQVTPQLLDSPTRAAIRLNLNGQFNSQNIGYNRSVKLHTQGFANIVAGETIAVTEQGLVPLHDAYADAALASQVNSIEHKLKIVRKIARKQSAKQKPQADAIAEGRLENRLRNQFHEQLSEQVARANARLGAQNLPVLTRLGLNRPTRSTWSSPQYLAMLWRMQEGAQLAAPASCPLIVEPTGVSVQAHESAITNLLDPVLAGRLIRSTEMDALATQFGNITGTGAKPVDGEEPWSIVMAGYHPVEVKLDNSLVTFRIRTTQLDRGDQSLDQPAAIEAAYRVDLTEGGIQLVRQGDVVVQFSGNQQRGVRAVTLRAFLRKKFNEVFREQLFETPLRLSDRIPGEFLKLQLTSVQVDDGWIQMHLQ